MASTYTSIATTTLSNSTTTSVSFNSFSGYTDLYLVINGAVTSTSGGPDLRIRFNGDSGANYSVTNLVGNGTTASSGRRTNTDGCVINNSGLPTDGFVQNINIMNYSNSTTYKTVIARSSSASSSSEAVVCLWSNTAAITSLSANVTGGPYFTSGTTFTLYGIKAA